MITKIKIKPTIAVESNKDVKLNSTYDMNSDTVPKLNSKNPVEPVNINGTKFAKIYPNIMPMT